MLTKTLRTLPSKENVSECECRYPQTRSGMRAFLETFFARHFFQVQDSLLQTDMLSALVASIRRGRLNIADIGSGPAVTSLAVLDMLSALHNLNKLHPISVRIILNDTSPVCLQIGLQMLKLFIRHSSQTFHDIQIHTLNTAFPSNLYQWKRTTNRFGTFDLFFLSYILIPLKEELKYAEIQEGIEIFRQYCASHATGLILQDKFRESLIRTVGRNLRALTEKATLQQIVYDKNNSNDRQIYNYYRTIIS